jgi:hypothetical protein
VIVLDALPVPDAEPERTSQRDVLRLANTEAFLRVGRIAGATGLRHRQQPALLSLGIDDLPPIQLSTTGSVAKNCER